VLSTNSIPRHKGCDLICYAIVQILRWLEPATTASPDLIVSVEDCGGSSSSQPISQKPVLSLVLQHPSQEPAAIAVLAALYGVSVEADELSQEQLLQAAVLADMWQIPGVATAAVQLLVNAAMGPGLSEAAAKAFLDLEAIPNCLLPLFSAVVSSGTAATSHINFALNPNSQTATELIRWHDELHSIQLVTRYHQGLLPRGLRMSSRAPG